MEFTLEQKLRVVEKIWGKWTITPILWGNKPQFKLTNYREHEMLPQHGIVTFTGDTIEEVANSAIEFIHKTLRLEGE